MNPNVNNIINLILQIREPQTVNEATKQFLLFLQLPQSINILFQIVLNPEINDFIYQYAIISISEFCKINKAHINEDNAILNFIRANLIQALINIKNEAFIPNLISTISKIIQMFPSDWPEIQQLAFSEINPSNIVARIQLLSILIPHFSLQVMNDKMNFFIQILHMVFESNNIVYQCLAVSLAVQLVKQTRSIKLAALLKPLISNLLQVVISNTNFDSNLLNQILNSVNEIEDTNLDLIDVEFGMKFTISVLERPDIPTYFQLQINNLFLHCFSHCEYNFAPFFTKILILEFNLTVHWFEKAKDDYNSLWTFEIGNIIDFIFAHMESETVIKNVKTNFTAYHNNNNEGVRFFQLILLNELAYLKLPNCENLLIEFFPKIFAFLQDQSQRIRTFATSVITYIVPCIKNYIIDNMETIMKFINQNPCNILTQDEIGSALLYSVIECASNTDDFIAYEYNIIKGLLLSPNLAICRNSMELIKLLFEKSKQHYKKLADDAYNVSINLIKQDPSRYSYMLLFIAVLLSKGNEYRVKLPEFITLILVGLNSSDYDIIDNSLSAITEYFNRYRNNGSEESIQISIKLFPSLKAILISSNDDPFVSKLKGSCLQSVTSLLYATNLEQNLLTFYFEIASKFISIDNSAVFMNLIRSNLQLLFLIESNKDLTATIVNNPNIQLLINQSIIKIINSCKFNSKFDYISISFISDAIKQFGFERLQINMKLIAKYILDELKYAINCDIMEKKAMRSITECIATITILNPQKEESQQTVNLFLDYLRSLLINQANVRHQVMAIQSFKYLLCDCNSQCFFTQQFFELLVESVRQLILSPNYSLAKNACSFFISIIKSNSEKLLPATTLILNTLLQRLGMIRDQQYQSSILRELITIAICRFDSDLRYVPLDQLITVVFSCMPLTYKIKYCSFMAEFLSRLQPFIANSPNLCKELYRVYALIISDRNKESSYITPYVLDLMAFYISQHDNLFQSPEDRNQFLLQIFKNDEVALQNFYQLYPIYLQDSNDLINPDLSGYSNCECIDLTNFDG